MDAGRTPGLTVRSRAQRIAGSAAAVAAALLVASVALAAPPGVSWSVSRQPGSVTAGVPTLVTVTVTNTSTTSEQIACIRINVPVAFAVVSASITSTPSGRKWSASVVGSTVTARAQNGGSTLRGGTDRDRVGIGVTVSGLVPGSHAWSAAAYGDTTCQKSMDLTASFNVTVTVLATPAPTPAPTPPPTPRPTPTPTPRPTPTPTPTATPSTPAAPSADPVRSDDPASPTPEPSPGRPDPTGDPGGPGPGPTAGATPSPSPTLAAAWAGRTPDRFEIRLRDSAAIRVDLSASLDAGSLAIQWGVPAIALSVPGLLVIGVVLAQTAGGLVWLPLVRRWVGAFGIWRRRRDGARPRR